MGREPYWMTVLRRLGPEQAVKLAHRMKNMRATTVELGTPDGTVVAPRALAWRYLVSLLRKQRVWVPAKAHKEQQPANTAQTEPA